MIELPDAPDWMIGVGNVGGIQMVTPGPNGIRERFEILFRRR